MHAWPFGRWVGYAEPPTQSALSIPAQPAYADDMGALLDLLATQPPDEKTSVEIGNRARSRVPFDTALVEIRLEDKGAAIPV